MAAKPTVAQMVSWFQERYKDPANGVPFNSAEGGYQYVHGGPYDASARSAMVFPPHVVWNTCAVHTTRQPVLNLNRS